MAAMVAAAGFMNSPTGKQFVPSEGPKGARLMLLGESPASRELEAGRPFVGRAGKILNAALAQVGIRREECRLVNVVPCRAPGDEFDRHHGDDLAWGLELLRDELSALPENGLIVALGDNPLTTLLPNLPFPPTWSDDEGASSKRRSRIGVWRGSLLPLREPVLWNTQSYGHVCDSTFPINLDLPHILPTYHPAAIARQFSWHPWFLLDLHKAKQYLDGKWEWPTLRQWYFNDAEAFERFVEHQIEVEHMAALDSEMTSPAIIAVCGEQECHTFFWDEDFREPLQRLLASPHVLKIAHNAGHDLTFLRKLGLDMDACLEESHPLADTGALGHTLDPSLQRNLSPALATRFTTWPYHKWLTDVDPLYYCGMDTIVAFDGYVGAIGQVMDRGLLPVVEHDHQLFKRLTRMQWRGVPVDEEARGTALTSITAELAEARTEFASFVLPVVRERIGKFEKPHLFMKRISCECCGGGTKQRNHCLNCWWIGKATSMQPVPIPEITVEYVKSQGFKTLKAFREQLPDCYNCEATGKVEHWKDINPDSPDQMADVLYRGYRVRARRYKGKETTRADQLAPLAAQHEVVDKLVNISKLDANRQTLERLTPDLDGRLHSVFDPWGTGRGRVASSEGLVQVGTNLQNIPLKHRYIIVPDRGHLMWAPDMRQIEGRCIAVISGDEALRKAYTEPIVWPGSKYDGKIDSHARLMQALLLYGYAISRDQSKKASYAGWYGAEADQLAVELSAEARRKGEGCEVSPAGAQKILDLIMKELYPGLQKWHDDVVESLIRTRQLISPTGRLARWNGYVMKQKNGAWSLVDKIAKEGWSFFPQDMAAWVLALAAGNLEREGDGLIELLIHVHDELVLQTPDSPGRLVDEARELIERCMTVEQWGMLFPPDVNDPSTNWKCAKGKHSDDDNGTCRHCGRVREGLLVSAAA